MEGKQQKYMVIIDLAELHGGQAKLDQTPEYLSRVEEQAGRGNDVVLTGAAPVWMYLKIAHALHGKVTSLWYDSPVTGAVVIFDHNPY